MNNFVKQAYVQGLAARAILRARIMQKRAGIGDYAMAGGIGAGGGAIIGALVNAARKKNLLHGALAGAGIGGVAGLGYQGIKDLLKNKNTYPLRTEDNPTFLAGLPDNTSITSTPADEAFDKAHPVKLNDEQYYNTVFENPEGRPSLPLVNGLPTKDKKGKEVKGVRGLDGKSVDDLIFQSQLEGFGNATLK